MMILSVADIMSNSCRDRINQLLADPSAASTLSTTGHGMNLAFKYVLPKLLIGPVYHCLSFFKYIELFKDLTTSDEDKESFVQAEGLLAPLKNHLDRVCKRNARPGLCTRLTLSHLANGFSHLLHAIIQLLLFY